MCVCVCVCVCVRVRVRVCMCVCVFVLTKYKKYSSGDASSRQIQATAIMYVLTTKPKSNDLESLSLHIVFYVFCPAEIVSYMGTCKTWEEDDDRETREEQVEEVREEEELVEEAGEEDPHLKP